MLGYLCTEELSWEIIVTRRLLSPRVPLPAQPIALFYNVHASKDSVRLYHCSKFMEEMWGSQGSMAHPILPRLKELPPACGTTSLPAPASRYLSHLLLALACRRWASHAWEGLCAALRYPVVFASGLLQVARDPAEINSKSARKKQIIYLGPGELSLTLSTHGLFPDILVFD